MELIRLFLSASWQSITLAVLTGLLGGASSAGMIALINISLRETNRVNPFVALGFIALCLILLISTAASQVYIARLAERIIFDLRLHLTRQILACPLRQLEEIGIPRLLAALTQDIEIIANASIPIAALCANIALLLGCLLYLSWLSLPLFGLTMVLVPLAILSNQYLIYRGRHFLKFAREEQDRLFQHFRTVTEGIKELKLHQQRRQAFLVEDLQATAVQSKHYRITAANSFAIGGSWGLVALFVLIGVFLFVVPLLFVIPSAVLSGYALTLIFMVTPLRGLLNTLPELLRANIALEKINTLGLSLNTPSTEVEESPVAVQNPGWRSLRITGVTHAYKGEREDHHFTLGPLSLTLSPGELIFIVGGNGSGKSTLVKLLTGLYAPETGTIEFDGQSITDANQEWYRQQFSVVFSDFYLFDRLLGLDNLKSGDRVAQEYLEKLHLDGKVKIDRGVFSSTALSQGQRKRLALLTAYLEDRSIYVFDEWASDQDPAFKKIFYTQLLPELRNQGNAVVVVSHDERYFDLADRIVKLDYGKIEYDKSMH
ncbi:ABC transporter ATP-binding protein [Chroococcidiopsis sp. CCALA 051]|uniref:cyclic peptide export ABC transporter n=1 Tax=Chroococcidiopsis sp. CCALA 051 TaxID=869949 RepID=UPI000D0DF9F2|nr:cyclic peptide export ABC transporter [Chroococcidiopsis sp. CCALA 051]MBE9019445.1 cyclic peptide export ABC transporter [Chroococcidiopsidales cyanobacterium LEGE 13417]PSM49951.1 ABC transporter ATP-binding protein [Chroococcidiopsis sp. CCALA 051]